MNKVGRPSNLNNPRRMWFIERYHLPVTKKTMAKLRVQFMDQLDRCSSDEARRLLLGVSQ